MPASPTKWFSAPRQNVVSTYVCLISNLQPNRSNDNYGADRTQNEDEVKDLHGNSSAATFERSKAVHEHPEVNKEPPDAVLKSNIKTDDTKTVAHVTEKSVSFIDEIATSSDATNADQLSEDEKSDPCANPKILKLTRMQWLSDSREGSVDASPSISTRSSISSFESELDEYENRESERCLSTILRLDKEHNLFGLSNITIISPKHSIRKMRRERNKAVFPQTAIINVCCPRGCCRHKSPSALPSSLKCGRCSCTGKPPLSGCCSPYACSNITCGSCNGFPICNTVCSSCTPIPCQVKGPEERCGTGGLTFKVKKKQPFEETLKALCEPEVSAQCNCELIKPVMARSCHHTPRCVPPSSFFPYILPCYWPARPAPCSEPTRCFHNPPCPRQKSCCPPVKTSCRKPCVDPSKPELKCTNSGCIGKKHGVPARPGHHETKKKKRHVLCQCILPTCENCFVRRPEKMITAEVSPEDELGYFDAETFEDTIELVRSSGISSTNKTQTNEQTQ